MSGEAYSRGFDAGNCDGAYVGEDCMEALAVRTADAGDEYVDGYVLGFFSTYEIHEVPCLYKGIVAALREKYGDD